MNSRATFESSHAGRTGAYAAGADGMSRSKSAPAPAAVVLGPRAKLYLMLLANTRRRWTRRGFGRRVSLRL